MQISSKELKKIIDQGFEEYGGILSGRVYSVIQGVADEEINRKSEFLLFELFVKILLYADRVPANTIANLLISINKDLIYQLDHCAIPDAGIFLRDYLNGSSIIQELNKNNGQKKT